MHLWLNGLVQDAVIRNFEILGEASRNVEKHSPGFAALHPELPLAVAYEMRNAVSHGYYKVNLQVVWNTLKVNPPLFHSQVLQALPAARQYEEDFLKDSEATLRVELQSRGFKIGDLSSADGLAFVGPIVAVSQGHVAQDTGRNTAQIHNVFDLDETPGLGSRVTIKYRDGIGVVSDDLQRAGRGVDR